MEPVVGFIGIGAMGAPMSRNLLKAGFPLIIYDLREKAIEELAAEGAQKASSPGDLARRCSTVITCLPASPEVEAAILGPGGVVEGAKPGTIVIDMSSSYPSSTIMICESLATKGINMLDAPISGGTKGAREGTLAIMVGGDEELFKECLPIFEAMGKNIYHVGKIGAGHGVKALNNLCSATTMAITSEALVLAAKMGLDPKKVIDVINSSSGQSWSSHFKFPTFVLNNAFNSGFTIALMNKDLDMATRLGREHYVPMFVGAAVQQLFNYAMSQGGGGECHTAIAKFIEDWGGVKVRSKQGG
jgi:3-hydroxyisobutyrate dehydrogenase